MTWFERAMAGDAEAIGSLFGQGCGDFWLEFLDGIVHAPTPSLPFIETLIAQNDDTESWFYEVGQAVYQLDDRDVRDERFAKARDWLRQGTISVAGEFSRPALTIRLYDVVHDPSDQDAGLEEAERLVQDALKHGMRDLAAEGLILSSKGHFYVGDYGAAGDDAQQAVEFFSELGNVERAGIAARTLAAAWMYQHRWDEALELYNDILNRRLMFGFVGKTFLPTSEDPVEDAIGDLMTVGMWADHTAPEWTRALGAVWQRLAETAVPGAEKIQAYYESSLENYYDTSEKGIDGLHVVIGQLDERELHAASMTASSRLIRVCEERAGAESGGTMIARNLFAAAARRAGEFELAEPHYREVAEYLVEADEPEAFGLLSNWAACLIELDRNEEALGALTQALTRAQTQSEKWSVRAQMVPVLPDGVARELAQALYEEIHDAGELATPAGSEAVVAYLSVLLSTGDARAIEVQESLLVAVQDVYGGPMAWLEEHNLGAVYANLGQFKKAKEVFESVLAKQKERLGAQHPHIDRTLSSIESVVQKIH